MKTIKPFHKYNGLRIADVANLEAQMFNLK